MNQHPAQVFLDLVKSQLALGQQVGESWQQSGERWAALQQQLLHREMFEVKTAVMRCCAVRDWQGAAWTLPDLLGRQPQWAMFAAQDVLNTVTQDQTRLAADLQRAFADWQRAAALALGQGQEAPPPPSSSAKPKPQRPRAAPELRKIGKGAAANDPAPMASGGRAQRLRAVRAATGR